MFCFIKCDLSRNTIVSFIIDVPIDKIVLNNAEVAG